MKIAIASFTQNGADVTTELLPHVGATFNVFDKTQINIKVWLSEQFYENDALIFVGAVGIATRLIAAHITTKDKDPAVIVIDEKKQFIIPILSGHLGGANALALKIAAALGATPVITTATDLNGQFAVDSWGSLNGCVIDDIKNIKHVSAAILAGRPVGFCSDYEIDGGLPDGLTKTKRVESGVCVSLNTRFNPFAITLKLMPKIITIGVGCKKNTDAAEFDQFVLETLNGLNLSTKAVRTLATIDLKKDEPCLLQFVKTHRLNMAIFTAAQLNTAQGAFTASPFVLATTGTDNVCERAAVLESGGALLTKKTSKNGMTLAVAVSNWRGTF